MKKMMVGLLVMVSIISISAQSIDSVFVKGACLNTCKEPFIKVHFTVFPAWVNPESIWSVYWSGHDGSEMMKKNYGLNMANLKKDMLVAAKAYQMRDSSGAVIPIKEELDVLNILSKLGYRYLKKEAVPQIPTSLVVMPITTVFLFERK